uniref:ANF_receptor domain-containing protein n=1 Tax=Heligmosomoides polygyrus TaxID=6339 RepID=A0A183F8I0_HELPZ
LFLKQALKGEAAASITYVPVIGDKYYGAVNILKKQYDREAIDEIITFQETTELITATLFGTYTHDTDNYRFSRQNESRQIELRSQDIASMPLW